MQGACTLHGTLQFFKQTLQGDFYGGGPGKLSPQKALDQSQAAALSTEAAKLGSGFQGPHGKGRVVTSLWFSPQPGC